ncbi:MAG TPA: zf-HC2 domain-containing protein [Longimicrobiales bacterium]|nr:zf-HC2 domain-containing protein [Longimicrobiales bacterium]
MNRYDCDTMRDLIPALVRGELLSHETAQAERHLDACAECRDELALVQLMQDSLAPVPAGLEARVLMAVRAAPLSPRRWAPARLAMAATLAAAVLGGSVIFERIYQRETPSVAVIEAASELSWAAAEDPMLHGGSQLHELSIEELEILLAELES